MNLSRNFANQFDDTDVVKSQLQQKFKALDEWSSLVALSIIAMVDRNYDVTLRSGQYCNSKVLRRLV